MFNTVYISLPSGDKSPIESPEESGTVFSRA